MALIRKSLLVFEADMHKSSERYQIIVLYLLSPSLCKLPEKYRPAQQG